MISRSCEGEGEVSMNSQMLFRSLKVGSCIVIKTHSKRNRMEQLYEKYSTVLYVAEIWAGLERLD